MTTTQFDTRKEVMAFLLFYMHETMSKDTLDGGAAEITSFMADWRALASAERDWYRQSTEKLIDIMDNSAGIQLSKAVSKTREFLKTVITRPAAPMYDPAAEYIQQKNNDT